ncbi:MAG: hypothetical protein HYS34_10415 [Acidobacteria bacterium]|nr:hypothetical protein [Acidobacteriota bacterium]
MKRFLPAALLGLLLVLLAATLSPAGRAHVEAIGLLIDVWSLGRETGREAGPPPATIAYEGPGGEGRQADVYCDPRARPRARLLLAHGLVEAGKDDSRLRALGRIFARHRFLVVVPDFPGMRALRVGREDIEEVGAAIAAARRLEGCPPAAGTGAGGRTEIPLPTGVVGFSYSAGPVILALGRPGAARQEDFAVLFGGYADLEDVVRFLTTGRHHDRGEDYGGEALPEGRWIVLQANAGSLAEPADREALAAIGRLRRADPGADISALSASLGPAGKNVLALFANTDPARFDDLFRRADPAVRATLDALSPSKSLAQPLPADLYLLHGRSDAIVPYTESLKLQRSVRTHGRVRLALLGGFRHARPQSEAGAAGWVAALRHPADSARILEVLAGILARRAEP